LTVNKKTYYISKQKYVHDHLSAIASSSYL